MALASLSVSSKFGLGIDITSRIWTPMVQQLRFRNRPNLQRPLPMHYKRVRMLGVCEPRYPPKLDLCDNVVNPKVEKNVIEENPYAVFLAKKMRRNFASHPMIAIFHKNSYKEHDMLRIRGMLVDANMTIEFQTHLNVSVSKAALKGTKWSPALQLLVSQTIIGYCTETNVPKFLKFFKKVPELTLLAIIVEDRLMHRVDYEAFAKLPDINIVRAQVCHTLNSAAVSFSRSLQANQLALSHSLTTYSSSTPTAVQSSDDCGSSDKDNSSSAVDETKGT